MLCLFRNTFVGGLAQMLESPACHTRISLIANDLFSRRESSHTRIQRAKSYYPELLLLVKGFQRHGSRDPFPLSSTTKETIVLVKNCLIYKEFTSSAPILVMYEQQNTMMLSRGVLAITPHDGDVVVVAVPTLVCDNDGDVEDNDNTLGSSSNNSSTSSSRLTSKCYNVYWK